MDKYEGFVTVFTDASFQNESGAAGWAAWIKHQGSTRRRSGHFRNPPENAAEAELAAAGIGILSALLLFEEVKTVHLVSDSQHALGKLTGGRPNNQFTRNVVDVVGGRLAEIGAFLSTAHVKAHRRPEKSRDWVNRWCDNTAKQRMREQDEGRIPMAWPRGLKITHQKGGLYRVRIGANTIGEVQKRGKSFFFVPEGYIATLGVKPLQTSRMTSIRTYLAESLDRDVYMEIYEGATGMPVEDI